MNLIFRQTQLYKFLNYCNEINLEKSVLDCGAGGNCPPLALFLECGYKTYGIEISNSQIERAKNFSKEHNVELNISKGDIRKLTFEDESISYIYSYNTIFHMKKEDIAKAVAEIKRVLKPGGICFINFLSVNDCDYGHGEQVGEGEFLQSEGDEKVIHTYYNIQEAETHFKDMKILFKENRILERIYEGEKIKQGYIDYIVQKNN
ncbi:methyltransferase domain-containing protein [Clostridium bowmanii]|uniref:class I SAM-dependent methyltransferase n=1 Tax=Clostridium bowmanii TaxID=132925 RepID=UPI001C0AA6E9|nr:methyltransferase domain-containing protein [Clostridium bowmanii]MBU3192273.1 methyltransferase domain-containing protein [Clostridium bowmanii]MCA1076457.1 methyltransferase domain-containing protein [Clostridium bowmanii]